MDQEPTNLWWGKMTQASGTQPHRPLTLQTCAAGLQTLLGLLYFAFGGGVQRQAQPGVQRQAQPGVATLGPQKENRGGGEKENLSEEDSFHGNLRGALSEHRGMPMVCSWHARPPLQLQRRLRFVLARKVGAFSEKFSNW